MRLAHLADLHLGYRQYDRRTPTGANQREADVAQAFRAAVDGVLAARPDAVVVAGDLFHTARPSNATIVFAFRQFQRLREGLPGAPLIVIAGNHDTPRSRETGSILRLFAELGVDVATDTARRLTYPALGLAVLAVPHAALLAEGRRRTWRPAGDLPHQVLLLHGEVATDRPADRAMLEHGGAPLALAELQRGAWSYVALGHAHVQQQIAPRIWYAGALEYLSNDIWQEAAADAALGGEGKGWLLADLESGEVTRSPVPSARGIHDLPSLGVAGLGPAEVTAAIQAALAAMPGGLDGQLVRLIVRDIPRQVVRELDHAALRALKARVLHLQLEFRRPTQARTIGVGAPGRRPALRELVHEYLRRRPLPAEVDRDDFVQQGVALLREPDV